MIDFSEAIIRKFTFHEVGNEIDKGFINKELIELKSEEETAFVKKILLSPFSSVLETYEFRHDIDIELNVLFKLTKSLYEGKDFLDKSRDILQHLKSSSKHPGIKTGDLFLVKLDDIKLDNKFYEGVGIYKIENKENFIETSETKSGTRELRFKKGVSGRKLDKACLIVFTKEPYTVLYIDNISNDADYWVRDFIGAKQKLDDANSTANLLSVSRRFILDQFPKEFEIGKAEQIDLLNKTVNYFKDHEEFNKREFEDEVFYFPEIIKSFKNFDKEFRNSNDLSPYDNFDISASVLKKQVKLFKSIIKLDKNFHIYIHGPKDLIEQGVDKNGRKFYKIYYDVES